MKLGEKIKILRTENKLTMEKLGEKSNLSKSYISMLEKGENPKTKKEIIPSLETVQLIANAFNITLEQLLVDVDSKVKLPSHNVFNGSNSVNVADNSGTITYNNNTIEETNPAGGNLDDTIRLQEENEIVQADMLTLLKKMVLLQEETLITNKAILEELKKR